MTALSILAIILSFSAIAFCIYTDCQHYEEDKATLNLIKQHTEIMCHMTNCIEMLEQRIKKLEEKVKKGENDG